MSEKKGENSPHNKPGSIIKQLGQILQSELYTSFKNQPKSPHLPKIAPCFISNQDKSPIIQSANLFDTVKQNDALLPAYITYKNSFVPTKITLRKQNNEHNRHISALRTDSRNQVIFHKI